MRIMFQFLKFSEVKALMHVFAEELNFKLLLEAGIPKKHWTKI